MTDDMRLLLRILLEQELREAEPEMQRPRKKREAEREDGIDYAPAESRGKTKRTKDTMKEELRIFSRREVICIPLMKMSLTT